MVWKNVTIALAGMLLAAATASGQSLCEEQVRLDDASMACYRLGPPQPAPEAPAAPDPALEAAKPDRLHERILRYASVALKHRLSGLASYYSRSLDGSLTANGERYRAQRYSAAHLTLPLGTWIEVRARATGRKLRLRVNDRGPYVNKFMIDLSESAARFLGVDVAADRHVDVRIIAMPGEEPLPEDAPADLVKGEEPVVASGAPAAAAAQ